MAELYGLQMRVILITYPSPVLGIFILQVWSREALVAIRGTFWRVVSISSKTNHDDCLGGGFKYVFYFHPEHWGRLPFWRANFSDGLKPPTSCWKIHEHFSIGNTIFQKYGWFSSQSVMLVFEVWYPQINWTDKGGPLNRTQSYRHESTYIQIMFVCQRVNVSRKAIIVSVFNMLDLRFFSSGKRIENFGRCIPSGLGGGFKYVFYFHPYLGEMIQFD